MTELRTRQTIIEYSEALEGIQFLSDNGLEDYMALKRDVAEIILTLNDGGTPTTAVKETQTLSDGQLNVTFTIVNVTLADIYRNGLNTDGGILIEGVDYTIDSTTQITLAASEPGGTLIYAVQG